MKTIQLLSLAALGLMTAMARAELVSLPIEYEAMSDKQTKALKTQTIGSESKCSFTITGFVDERQNKETVAQMFGESLHVSNLDDYLNTLGEQANKLTQVKDAEYQVSVVPRLIRLYSYPQSLNILGVSAAVFDFQIEGKTIHTQQMRGFYAKTNWAGANSEYLSALNYASNELIANYASNLPGLCERIMNN